MDEFDKNEVKIDLYKRWRKLAIKQLSRDLVCFFALIGQLIGFLGIMGLFLLTILLSMFTLLKNLTTIDPNADPILLFSGFKLFTFDQYYITWIIPLLIFIISWVGYRICRPRNESDILIEALKQTLQIFGIKKRNSGSKNELH